MSPTPRSIRLGTVIASRTIQRGDGSNVVVRLGQPRRSGNDWLCPFQIKGLAEGKVKRAFGVDSMQALQLALEAIRIDLHTSANDFTWLEQPDMGFYRVVPTFIGARRVARLNRAIERELTLWGRAVRRRGRPPVGQRTTSSRQ